MQFFLGLVETQFTVLARKNKRFLLFLECPGCRQMGVILIDYPKSRVAPAD